MTSLLIPPFTEESASKKVQIAENLWNTRNPEKVVLAYSSDTKWRNRITIINNRDEAKIFLENKWKTELDYRLIKELWAYNQNKIAVRFAYEWHDNLDNWFRSYGNENWEFQADGLMSKRFACINDKPIKKSERLFDWTLGARPVGYPSLTELDL